MVSVVIPVLFIIAAVRQNRIQSPLVAEVGRDAARADLDAATAVGVDRPAVEQPKIFGGKPRHITGVLQHPGSKIVVEFLLLELAQFRMGCRSAKSLHPPDDLRPSLLVAGVAFVGRAIAFDSVFLGG